MMRKPTGHKEKHSNRYENSHRHSNDGTAARTRPLSFDEIMLRRKNKRPAGSVEDQRLASEIVSGKEVESVSGRVESDRHRHRHRDVVGASEQHASNEKLKVKRLSGSVEDQRLASAIVSGKEAESVSGRVESDRHRHRHRDVVGASEQQHASNDTLKVKRLSGSVEDQRLGSEIVSGKEVESVSGRVESDRHRHRHRHRDVYGAGEQHASNDTLKVSSRTKESESNFKMREEKRVEGEHKESDNAKKRLKVGSDNAKDRRKERGINDSDNEYGKSRVKDSTLKERDRIVERNRGNSEHVSVKDSTLKERDRIVERHRGNSEHVSKRTQNGYERKQSKVTSESHLEDLKLRSKRSRSREHERDKRRSSSPSQRGNKQRLYDVREREELSSHSIKDKPGRFDSNIDRKRVSDNASSNKSKRHDTSASRLGGYSPRKRRSEAAVKTPSPTASPTVKMETKLPNSLTSFQPDLMSVNKIEVLNRYEVPSVVPLTSSIPKPAFGVLFPSMMNASVDSVQLTQATRPKRRIYVENLPSSASEAAVVEWLSGYLRPYGLNHVQATSPCISCIVNKDKCQALVEFLTPEDASTALSFDGKSFSGNVLKIRRPKDYVEATTGVSEKPVAAAVSVKNIVEDSPNKLFIGGISKIITSKMLLEICSSFGPLKAYHFEANSDLESPCAFIEYADQSVTIKACVGLNGMKLGGQLLTVTQATPDTSGIVSSRSHPFYGTPMHVQPLLQKQTQVLKLNNVIDPQSLASLSELDLEEILEDVRLECARFGMVKSINIVKLTEGARSPEIDDPCIERGSESVVQNNCHDDVAAPGGGCNEQKEADEAAAANSMDEDSNQINSGLDQLELNDSKPADDGVPENKLESFEGGCVLVEFKRIEASAMAAHCLHGRIFDGRIVSVEYVTHDVYCARFKK